MQIKNGVLEMRHASKERYMEAKKKLESVQEDFKQEEEEFYALDHLIIDIIDRMVNGDDQLQESHHEQLDVSGLPMLFAIGKLFIFLLNNFLP